MAMTVTAAAIVAGVATLLAPHVASALTLPALLLTGALVAMAAARTVGDDRVLRVAVTGSYAVKAGAAVALYYVSDLRLPVLRSLQLGDGWWTFARDAGAYDTMSRRVLDAWQRGTSLPVMATEKGPVIAVALVYRVLGAHPLHVVLLNAVYGALTVTLAVLFLRRFVDDRWTLRASALLLAFWPSLTLWSTQLVKEAFVVFVLVFEAYLLARLWDRPSTPPRAPVWPWVAIALLQFVLQFIRDYAAFAIGVGALVGVLVVGLRAGLRPASRGIAILGIVLLPAAVSSNVDLLRVAAPWHPEEGHLRLGLERHRRRDLRGALEQYAAAIRIEPRYAAPYRDAAVALACEGDLEGAARGFEAYLALAGGPAGDAEAAGELARIRGPRALARDRSPAARRDCPGLPLVDGTSPASAWRTLVRKLRPDTSVFAFVRRADPAFIGDVRRGMVSEGEKSGWRSLVDPDTRLRGFGDIVRYLPRGLTVLFFTPFPSQWLDRSGDAGALKLFAGLETLGVYVLVPAVVAALVAAVRAGGPMQWSLATLVFLVASILAVAVPNAGALFRLRVQVLVPLVLFVASLGVPARLRVHLARRRLPHRARPLGSASGPPA